MKTDKSGRSSAANDTNEAGRLEARLAGAFQAQLRQAERDYPGLVLRAGKQPGASFPGSPRLWQRLAVPVAAVAVVAIVMLVGVGLAYHTGPGTPGSVEPTSVQPPASGVVMGADGIPSQVDGQRVYRVTDRASFPESGSFLLAGYVANLPIPCPLAQSSSPVPSPDAALVGTCNGLEMASIPDSDTRYWDVTNTRLQLAPSAQDVLIGWLAGPDPVVLRVHTHDPLAADCAADNRAACEDAIVVEAVVWPSVPAELAGEPVYRASQQASFPTASSFLLGGVVDKPTVIPPCVAPIGRTKAEDQLLPYCSWISIDGLHLAPASNVGEPARGEIVIARVHIHDRWAAQCPGDVMAECEAAVVVEEIVWSAQPVPEPSASGPASTATPSRSPGAIGPLDADGVPASIGGEDVYRPSNVPEVLPSFLLGGRLTRNEVACAVTSRLGPCNEWLIDYVNVRASVDIPESMDGHLAVVRIMRQSYFSHCVATPCQPVEILVLTGIVWQGPPVPARTFPTPFAPSAPPPAGAP
jgi:hypothetical protein